MAEVGGWVLILVLYFGTPDQRDIVLMRDISWHYCLSRAIESIRPNNARVRCEPLVTRS